MKSTDRIADIIRALLAKTVSAGATEAEAMSAAEKARELLDKYQLDLDDVAADPVKTDSFERAKRGASSCSAELQTAVGIYSDCIAWTQKGKPCFTGRESDILFATWLLEALDAFCSRRILAYAAEAPIGRTTTAAAVEGFKAGLVTRIRERLKEATAARPRAARVAAHEANAIALRKEGIVLSKARRRAGKAVGQDAYAAGRGAGDGATFSRPMNGGRGIYQIAS